LGQRAYFDLGFLSAVVLADWIMDFGLIAQWAEDMAYGAKGLGQRAESMAQRAWGRGIRKEDEKVRGWEGERMGR
jgi:hypothetical protein